MRIKNELCKNSSKKFRKDFGYKKSDKVILLKQFVNQGCVDAHLFGTATEILNDMSGNIDAIIASVGTSATLTGIAQALKTSNPELYTVAVEPLASNVLNGGKKGLHKIHGIGAGFIPPLYKKELVDEVFDVSDDDVDEDVKERKYTRPSTNYINAKRCVL